MLTACAHTQSLVCCTCTFLFFIILLYFLPCSLSYICFLLSTILFLFCFFLSSGLIWWYIFCFLSVPSHLLLYMPQHARAMVSSSRLHSMNMHMQASAIFHAHRTLSCSWDYIPAGLWTPIDVNYMSNVMYQILRTKANAVRYLPK